MLPFKENGNPLEAHSTVENADNLVPRRGYAYILLPQWWSPLEVSCGPWAEERALTGFTGSQLVFTVDFQVLAVSLCALGLMASSEL